MRAVGEENSEMLKTMLEEFRAPGMKFRGVPLWAWNSKLERGELIRQIRLLKEMGFGGFFMHA